MSDFRVISAGLNLRSSGVVAPDNIIAVLPQGQIVTRISSESDSEKWWQVRTILGGRSLDGFVSKSFLSAVLDQFGFPPPNSSILGKKLNLWATFYFIPLVNNDSSGIDLLDMSGKKLGVKLSAKDWCSAAVEGTVNVRIGTGETKTFNFAGTGAVDQVNCRPFFPSLATISKTNKTRFGLSKGIFGEGVDGLKLVPYRSIAVDRSEIAIGTVIYIPAARGVKVILPSGESVLHDGYFFAADVGGAIKDNHNGSTLKGFVSAAFLRQPVSTAKEALISAAVKEWLRFDRGDKLEFEDPQYKYVGEYWSKIGLNLDGKDRDQPWSAAFISFVARAAGYNDFKFAPAHSTYVYDAVNKRKLNVTAAPFWGFKITEHKPQLGDLVCRWRENPITSIDSLPSGGFKSHCDIVVEIRDSEVRTLGGNVNQSVSITAYPLNSDGFLRPANNVYGVLRNNF